MTHCILLRGLAREHAHWGDFTDQLQVMQPSWQIHCLDLPGFGDFAQQASPTTIAGLADHIESLLPEDNTPKVAIALSLGGMVALELLARGAIQYAVAINTSSLINPFWQRIKPSALPSMTAALLSPSTKLQERLVLQQVCNNKTLAAQHLPQWLNIQAKRPMTKSNAVRQLIAASRFEPPQIEYGEKLTLLASASDKLVSVECSKRLAAHYRAKLIVHPSAGHDLPLEDPEWVLEHSLNAINSSANY